jgi:hypothetical protein
VNPIRPAPLSPPDRQVAPARDDAAKLAAQRAFFQAAMGIAPAQAAAPAPAYAAPVRVERTPEPATAAPQKILRPGSLLDIRV